MPWKSANTLIVRKIEAILDNSTTLYSQHFSSTISSTNTSSATLSFQHSTTITIHILVTPPPTPSTPPLQPLLKNPQDHFLKTYSSSSSFLLSVVCCV
ncbi:hypothetical protein D9613_011976 [Agrocybe pediades]|uniref:Uncharacterized protein n=1 Tax=Agrocybe pediades TaxID=84607 RepID=A0A8H4VHD6_9AGAR|nr:hypothetical protein D9613_011976 [Agrocybe pediades]